MEHLQHYLVPYSISNAIALVILVLTWNFPTVGRIALGLAFTLASIVNGYTALTEPGQYLDYRDLAVLECYREFIDGWFSRHTATFVLPIALGQFLIGIGMFLGGYFLKPSIIGIVIFCLAIAPLGVGSAFPCSIILGLASIFLWPSQARKTMGSEESRCQLYSGSNGRRVDSCIQLSDKRKLAYSEYGEKNGSPIFLFHGLPGSRLSWGLLPNGAFPQNVRLIAPDRPGYGQADPKANRTLLDWANDVQELADALKIKKFSIVGVSGGGPGALACAWSMPERLHCVGVVSSAAPPNSPGVFKGMSRTNHFFFKLAWRLPWLSTLNLRLVAYLVRHYPASYIKVIKHKLNEVDRAALARPEIQQFLIHDFREALQNGADGMIADMSANHGRPWGFSLHEIEAKVYLWSCELDSSVPPAMGRYLSQTIPNCHLSLVPNAGHLWILDHLNDVIAKLHSNT